MRERDRARAFFFLLWMSTFLAGFIYVGWSPQIGTITLIAYSYIWVRWSQTRRWFLE